MSDRFTAPRSPACLVAVLALALALACAESAATAAEVGYYSQPALHGDRLVFVCEGDLWTTRLSSAPADDAPAKQIVAFRLTSGDGIESHPRFSPDGTQIAFAGQYDGNTDVYLMPVDGGSPARLTYHPADDQPLAWMPDGSTVLFRSGRRQHFGRYELWQIAAFGGMPRRFAFGECSMVSVSSTGRRFAFTPWSNENWHWKGYRGGTAPDVWIGDLTAESFVPLTRDPANDLFPMWLAGRVFFLSDRAGAFNLHSDLARGGDTRQHTFFRPDPGDPLSVDGYDVRWPSADAARRGTSIVFCQGGGLALYDAGDDGVRRLDVRIASDRVSARKRFADAAETWTEIALSPDGETLYLGTRGEVFSAHVGSGTFEQLTRTSGAREWGVAAHGDEQIVLISDGAGEQQIALMPVDGSDGPSLVTEDRETWLFPPVSSSDGRWIAFGDKDGRLHTVDMQSLERRQIDRTEAGEITDYRFSPDVQWLAYSKPTGNGLSTVHIFSLRTRRAFDVSDGMSNDREPRWDPAGKYLYFLSDRHFNPVLDRFDMEHVYVDTARIYAVPLANDTPPPVAAVARDAGFDLDAWAKPPAAGNAAGNAAEDAGGDAAAVAPEDVALQPGAQPGDQQAADEDLMRIDTDGMALRATALEVEPGNYRALEALWGSVAFLVDPPYALLDRSSRGGGALGPGRSELVVFSPGDEKREEIAEGIERYVVNRARTVAAWPGAGGAVVKALAPPAEPKTVDLATARVRVDVREEWKQLLDEAWRLQRDFYWAPNYVGVDWPAMREKYAALLPRVGTRDELNDLVGEMIGELGTSHTYIWGGQKHEHERPEAVSVGMLGADIDFDGFAYRIKRIVPGQTSDPTLASPLEAPHLGISEGHVILAVNGASPTPSTNLYDLLQDQAGKRVTLTVADDAGGTNRRTVVVRPRSGERELRYRAWVDANRRAVAEASGGAIGYLHIPDMGGRGLSVFSRQFYPQFKKRALVIDVRSNGGGFVSQMIIERLAREVIGFMQPRLGETERYPSRAPHAHMAVIVDQHAGSDGDIFPAAFKRLELGPLIGTRTWGGVIGIRGDKPFMDLGLSTQPEFAWWDSAGWSIENEGVSPDIEVPLTPSDRLAGSDPQLDRAVSHLLERLQADPKELPSVPPYPVRPPR